MSGSRGSCFILEGYKLVQIVNIWLI